MSTWRTSTSTRRTAAAAPREAGTPNDGFYNFKAHLFGATFTWNF